MGDCNDGLKRDRIRDGPSIKLPPVECDFLGKLRVLLPDGREEPQEAWVFIYENGFGYTKILP